MTWKIKGQCPSGVRNITSKFNQKGVGGKKEQTKGEQNMEN